MEHSRLPFKTDPQSPLPINVQIKEQIKWLISKDFLKADDALPSTNELAEQLSVNRNTIQWIYSQLKEEGLLIMQKGRGTQIANEDRIKEFKQQNPYFSFVEKTVKDAFEQGFNIENVMLSGFAYTQLFGAKHEKKKRYLFIECKTMACLFYLEEIQRRSSADIQSIDISSPDEELFQAIQKADVVVTVNEMTEVVKKKAGSSETKIISVSSSQDVTLLFDMLLQ